ncbi:MAG TPA: molybdenum cofactor guanylyltransferase [Candidatus Limnocylindrales bacterium]|nr:molybdenum cofactor guanylyltransferase [Candidatus Limnocylindrales bacterium]
MSGPSIASPGATLPAATAIVLAGGRSSRFGRDKLAEPVGGRRLLDHAVTAAASVAREVLVLVPPVAPAPPLPAADAPVVVVRDPEPFGGPLVAVLAGLERARESLALVVGGDMPSLSSTVLAAMLRRLDSSGADAVVLGYRGRPEPLPAAFRVGAATPAARRLLGSGVRSLQSLAGALRTVELAEMEWRSLDPAAATLRDVDRPEDLPT